MARTSRSWEENPKNYVHSTSNWNCIHKWPGNVSLQIGFMSTIPLRSRQPVEFHRNRVKYSFPVSISKLLWFNHSSTTKSDVFFGNSQHSGVSWKILTNSHLLQPSDLLRYTNLTDRSPISLTIMRMIPQKTGKASNSTHSIRIINQLRFKS